MWLIAGLGNPGKKYKYTRHNIGFMCLDHFLESNGGGPPAKEEKKALVYKFFLDKEALLLVKPQTYMNLSGESIIPLMKYYKVPQDKLIILHDEVDLPYEHIRLQKNRGPGGHNGIKSVNQHLGHKDYIRIRLGVGRPSNPRMDVADYVLQNFSKREMTSMNPYLDSACDAIESIIFDGFLKAQDRFNTN